MRVIWNKYEESDMTVKSFYSWGKNVPNRNNLISENTVLVHFQQVFYLLGFCLLIPNCEMFYWKSAFSVTVIASHLFVLCKWFLNHKLISWLGLGSMQCHEDQLVLDITQERPSTDGCHHYHYSVTLQSRLPGMLSQPHSHVVFVAFSQMLVCHTICKVTYIHPVWLSVTEFIPIIQRD